MTDNNYLGSERHLASLGANYAEHKLPREVPTQFAGLQDEAFFSAYDAYRHPDFLTLPYVSEIAVMAADAIGDTKTNRYARDIASDATEYVSNPDWGSSLSLVLIDEADRVALCLLSAIEDVPRHYERGTFIQGPEDWARCTASPEDWEHVQWMVVYVDERGFGNPDFFASEAEARADYEDRARDTEWFDDEDEEHEDVPAVCALCGGLHETPATTDAEDEILSWSDACETHNPLLGSVKRTESYGGTE